MPSPITTVPVRELNTTRARTFRLHLASSNCDIKATRPWTGWRADADVGRALRGRNAAKRRVDRRRNIVGIFKEGRFRLSVMVSPIWKSLGISRSTDAPFGISPAVGVFTVTLEPLAPVAFIPPTTTLPCARA
jgi:hypothetical protein